MLVRDTLVRKMHVRKQHSKQHSSNVSARAGQLLRARGGFTLLEVMIATAVTLLMMLALAQIFKVIGDSMKQGRAALELNNRLRSVVYRLRTDLDHLTAIPEPPADPATATGYVQIFDGSITDFTTASIPHNNSASIPHNIPQIHSRFGDIDDVFMATVRAGDVWFTGKVPAYILAQRAPTSAADTQMVSIASQYAEIAVFAQPFLPDINGPPITSFALGAVLFQDTDPLPNYPDSFRLHHRSLLIRPDLNLPNGLLPGGQVGGNNGVFWTRSSPVPGLPSPLCDMASVHQQCDLSVRRVFDPSNSTPGFDPVAANSLEDLMDPANRFAHVQVPIPGTHSTTMPLLALGVALGKDLGVPVPPESFVNFNNPAADPSGTLISPPPVPTPANFRVGSGFLHPAFVLRGDRTGEDVLASNILAFDIKVFDPGVPLLDLNNFVLSPNDPGYAAALTASNPPASVAGTGEYVDLAWARKLVAHGGSISTSTNVWSPYSGFSQRNFDPLAPLNAFTNALYKSGYVLLSGNNTLVLQPSYDTWTSRYEGDGVLQAQVAGGAGVVRIDGAIGLYGLGSGTDAGTILPPWKNNSGVPMIDPATDGLDNNPPPGVQTGFGIDDSTELETSAPYPSPLRGLRISVRMEDPLTRQIKQMSAGKEFVTQQ